MKLDRPYCGCEFACDPLTEIKTEQIGEYTDTGVILRTERYVACPQCRNRFHVSLADLLEYNEEPTPTQTLDEVQKLMKVIEEFKGDLSRIDYSNVALIRFCKHLIANGVTFREG